jgi:hypothetical protein
LLFVDRGWTPEAFEAWFADTLVKILLDETDRRRNASEGRCLS